MRTIKITITHAEIMREIAKWSYTIGETIGDEQPKLRHVVQGATDEGHRDLIMARAKEAWADLLSMLAAYTTPHKCVCGCNEGDCCCGAGEIESKERIDTDDCDDFMVELYFPDDTYPNLGKTIGQCCYRYITAMCRSEWEHLLNKDNSRSELEAERASMRLKVVITQRTKVGRVSDFDWYLTY